MEIRTFGKTGLEASVLGFGGAPVGFLEIERRQVATLLNGLLDQGVNLIDTAAGYKGSEEAIGEAVGHRRDDYVLVSKCGQAFPDIEGPAWSERNILATVDRALRRLRTDRLDVMLLHTCDLDVLEKGEALGALVKARDAGKVRHVGYSGDNEAALYAVGLPDVAVLETSVNIADQANIDTVLPAAATNNVGVLAKRPIANAAWRPAAQREGIYVDYAKVYSDRLARMGLTPADVGFPADAWSEVALRFTLAQPGVTTAIVGSTRPANVAANIAAAAKGPLPADAIKTIRDSFNRARGDEDWPGQR
jgi:aryl-alcohol dehydrogenase-like predicted oxidoreductase